MTDERMPTSGRLLEGSIAFIGCAVIVGMHGYMLGRSTLLRIGGWWRDQQIVRAEEKAHQRERRAAAWDSFGCLEDDDAD